MTRVVHKHKEPFDVYIGRPSKWGNPFSHMPHTRAQHRVGSRNEAIARYREWLLSQPELVEQVKRELKGKVLGCWCAPLPCHGDILVEIANAPEVVSPRLFLVTISTEVIVLANDPEHAERVAERQALRDTAMPEIQAAELRRVPDDYSPEDVVCCIGRQPHPTLGVCIERGQAPHLVRQLAAKDNA